MDERTIAQRQRLDKIKVMRKRGVAFLQSLRENDKILRESIAHVVAILDILREVHGDLVIESFISEHERMRAIEESKVCLNCRTNPTMTNRLVCAQCERDLDAEEADNHLNREIRIGEALDRKTGKLTH